MVPSNNSREELETPLDVEKLDGSNATKTSKVLHRQGPIFMHFKSKATQRNPPTNPPAIEPNNCGGSGENLGLKDQDLRAKVEVRSADQLKAKSYKELEKKVKPLTSVTCDQKRDSHVSEEDLGQT